MGREVGALLSYSVLQLHFYIRIISSRFNDYFYVIDAVCYILLSNHETVIM